MSTAAHPQPPPTVTVSPRAPSRTRVRSWVSAHPVAAFFVLAFAFSWTLWLAPSLGLRGVAGALLVYAGVFGPAVAGAVVVRATGGSLREWLRQLRLRTAPRWYVVAILAPSLIVAALSGVFVATGGEIDFSLLGERLVLFLPLLLIWSFFAVGEEFGWRGFALPHLQLSLSPVRATLIIGVLWAFWHLPLLAAADEPSHGLGPLPLLGVTALTFVAIVGYAFFYTYLYNKTHSIGLAILLHGSLSAANAAFLLVPSDDLVAGTYAHLQVITTMIVIVAAAALIAGTRGRLGLAAGSAPPGIASSGAGGAALTSSTTSPQR